MVFRTRNRNVSAADFDRTGKTSSNRGIWSDQSDQPFVQCGGSDHLYYPWDRILSTGTGGSGVLHCRALHWIWDGSKQWAEDRAASGVMCAGSIIYQSIIWKLNSTR